MYKKLIKAFILRNISLFTIIIVSMSLSMIGYFVSTNLITNSTTLITNEIRPIAGGDIIIDTKGEPTEDIMTYLQDLEAKQTIEMARGAEIFTTLESNNGDFKLGLLLFIDPKFPFYRDQSIDMLNTDGLALMNQAAYDIVKNQANSVELFGNQYPIKGIITNNQNEFNVLAQGRGQVYLPYSELENSQLSINNSLIEYNIYVKVNDPENFEKLLADIEQSPLFKTSRVKNYKRGGERFLSVISTLNEFISYILIVSFLFSILIIFLSIESFFISEKKTFSILKILGLSIYKLIAICLLIFTLIFAASFGISYLFSELIFVFIRSFELSSDFILYQSSLINGVYLGAIILFVSVVAPLLKFIFHSPLDGLKQNFLQIYSKSEIFIQILLVFLGIFSLGYILGGTLFSILFSSGVMIVALLILIIIITLLLKIFYKTYGVLYKKRDFIKYDAIRNTIKPGNLSGVIVLSFLIIYTSFIFISTLFLNFYDRLNINAENDKNLFIINLTQENYEKLDKKIQADTYKILKARISKINDIELKTYLDQSSKNVGRGRFTREFNITDNILSDVPIIDGVSKISSGEVSIDEGFSKDSGIQLGDKVEFLILGFKNTLTVTNIRESMEGSVNPFFYFQVYPDDFEKFPKTYFIATNVESENISQFKRDTIEQVGGNISFIEVDNILKQVKSISLKILTLIQVLYGYILIFSIMSIIICIQFFKIFQNKKRSLYHTLGASKNTLQKNSIFEYNYLQTIGAVLSLFIATGISYYILSISSFIDFSLINYIYSLLAGIVIFMLISLFIRYSLKSSN